MALFGCILLINIGEGFVAIARWMWEQGCHCANLLTRLDLDLDWGTHIPTHYFSHVNDLKQLIAWGLDNLEKQ